MNLGRVQLTIVLFSLAPVMTSIAAESMNMMESHTTEAHTLMMSFAQRTGLNSDRPQRRYLWTDAFAVCNFLGLARTTGEESDKELALRLVDRVHQTLGRHRKDDARTGWISGLSEREGEVHPTLGGLRIGKNMPERGADEPFDENLEWERDGQYFHYLSKWMHALNQVSRSTGDPRFNRWAIELAQTAHDAFTYQPAFGITPSMYWKMSIDLTRALVPSMGQHDPLDGYITYLQLHDTATELAQTDGMPDFEHAISRFAAMTETSKLVSRDPLGIGGLLVDAHRVALLRRQGEPVDERLLERLLSAAHVGLQYYAASGQLNAPVEYRLAFRELGLAIGLHAVQRMWQADAGGGDVFSTRVHSRLEVLIPYLPLSEQIESFWRDPQHQRAGAWSEHRDINDVMLATSLAPDGFFLYVDQPYFGSAKSEQKGNGPE